MTTLAVRGVLFFGVLFLAVPTDAHGWFGDRAVPAGRPLPGGGAAGAPGPGFSGKRGVPRYQSGPLAPPHPSQAAVIELLEDDAGRLARSLNPGADLTNLGQAGAWGEDCYSGATSLKIAGYQRFRETLPGWNYPVVETPRPGEYRYLRFAWKKPEGRGVMVQLCLGAMDWGRYFAGENIVGFVPALQVNPAVPREWEVVTRDLFADFGNVPFTLTGFAFTSMDGVALFDHVYLGRTIEDLDKVTNAAKSWARKADLLGTVQLEQFWADLASEDAVVHQPAVWALGACGKSSTQYLAERLTIPDGPTVEKRLKQLITDLDSPRFPVRERASKDLESADRTALPLMEAALAKEGVSAELRMRLEKLIVKCKLEVAVLSGPQRMYLRTMHVLEQAENDESKALLHRLAEANLDAGLSQEAKAALERTEKRRVRRDR